MKIPFWRKRQPGYDAGFEPETPCERRYLAYQIASLQGIGARNEQQDAFGTANADDVLAIKDNGLLAVVADGIGGMLGGRQASERVVRSLIDSFNQMDMKAGIPEQLNQAVANASDDVLRMLEGQGGSTVVACVIHDENFYFSSVGDSCLFLLRRDQLCRVNIEQNCLTQEYRSEIRAGRMNQDIGLSSREAVALTHYMGMENLDEMDYLKSPLHLVAGDMILVCSDGVGDYIPEEEIRQCLLSGSPRDVCSQLEERIIRANSKYQDNYTAIVIQCRY